MRLSALVIAAAAIGCTQAAPRPDGAPAGAPLVVTDMGGARHDLDAALARGETVALIFWQTWCESCMEETPSLVDAWRRHGDAIRFIGVVPGPDDVVDEGEVAAVVREHGIPYPQVRDRDLAITRRFGVDGTPTIVILGAGAEVRYSGHRPPDDWATYRGVPVVAATR